MVQKKTGYVPPYNTTAEAVRLISEISEMLGNMNPFSPDDLPLDEVVSTDQVSDQVNDQVKKVSKALKPNSRIQKYRITSKGLAFFNRLR